MQNNPPSTDWQLNADETGAAPEADAGTGKRSRGRPAGQPMRTTSTPLRHHQFSFLRSLILGLPLRKSWSTYLAFDGGPDDERHFAAQGRELVTRIEGAAAERGLLREAQLAFGGGMQMVLARRSATNALAEPTTSGSGQQISGSANGDADVQPPCPAPSQPSLDDWIAERCAALGVDVDFQSQKEWLVEYQDEFGLDQEVFAQTAVMHSREIEPRHGTKTAAPSPALPMVSVDEQLRALNALAGALATPPELSDPLSGWLTPELAKRLANTAVSGKPLPLLTVGNLISMVNLHHHRWWRHVPRLGAVRARRLLEWLVPLADALGQPVRETALKPYTQRALEQQAAVSGMHPGSRSQFGIVPLDRLAVPPEMDGRHGAFRSTSKNTLGAETDLEAIFTWLNRFRDSPRTLASYSRIVERFYLWSICVKRKAMTSLTEPDLQEYRQFMAKPPADWVQMQRATRESADWRPFKKGVAANDAGMNVAVIGGLFKALMEAGYTGANPARALLPSMRRMTHNINIDRSFDEAQWRWLMVCWEAMYEDCGPTSRGNDADAEPRSSVPLPDDGHPDRVFQQAAALRRTRLALELGATTGLRLIEFVTTRMSAVSRQKVDEEWVWLIKVHGKGRKDREAVLFDDVKRLLDQHHKDMERAGTGFDPTNQRVRSLENPLARECGGDHAPERPALPGQELAVSRHNGVRPVEAATEAFDAAFRPLIGALRRTAKQPALNALGMVARPQEGDTGTADQYGALDPTAFYQSLKRFFKQCATRARKDGTAIDTDALEAASTHWLRHFFANSAVDDGVDIPAIKDALGHASLATTSIYLRQDRRRLVKELSKMKRR